LDPSSLYQFDTQQVETSTAKSKN